MKEQEAENPPLTYTSYLSLHPMLDLQHQSSAPPEHDELLFIITHQTYELWFKLLLHELEKIAIDFSNNDLFGAIHTFKRCRTMMKTLIAQIDIVETMTPRSFAQFYEKLEKVSEFQSFQFREVEFFLGYKRSELVEHFAEDDIAMQRLQHRLEAPSLVDHFYTFLAHQGADLPQGLENREPTASNEPNEKVQLALYNLYQKSRETGFLFELMLDFDEGIQEWRYRHSMMVARVVGQKTRAENSMGVAFLRNSTFKPIFPDLWAIRHRF